MNFLFDHDGHTYAKHTECPDQGSAQVLFDQVDAQRGEELPPLEPSGDSE